MLMRATDYTIDMLIEMIYGYTYIQVSAYDFHIDTEFMHLFEIIAYDYVRNVLTTKFIHAKQRSSYFLCASDFRIFSCTVNYVCAAVSLTRLLLLPAELRSVISQQSIKHVHTILPGLKLIFPSIEN